MQLGPCEFDSSLILWMWISLSYGTLCSVQLGPINPVQQGIEETGKAHA